MISAMKTTCTHCLFCVGAVCLLFLKACSYFLGPLPLTPLGTCLWLLLSNSLDLLPLVNPRSTPRFLPRPTWGPLEGFFPWGVHQKVRSKMDKDISYRILCRMTIYTTITSSLCLSCKVISSNLSCPHFLSSLDSHNFLPPCVRLLGEKKIKLLHWYTP